MSQIPRRGFIGQFCGAIAAIFCAHKSAEAAFVAKASGPHVSYPPGTILTPQRGVEYVLGPLQGQSIANWISVKERRPRFGEEAHGQKLLRVEASHEKGGTLPSAVCIGRLAVIDPDGTNAEWEVQLPPNWPHLPLDWAGPKYFRVTHWAELPA